MATRRERVVLELQDDFSTGMARAAASAALFKRELDGLSGTSIKGAARDMDKVGVSAEKTAKSIDKVGKSSENSAKEIDRVSGRLRLFTDAAMTIGPALIPIGAAAVPAVLGLAAGFGAAAAAAGTAVLAFNGVGDALKAMDTYQLEPTKANLQAMQAEFDKIGPAGEQFVRFLDGLEPELHSLQDAARAGLFPGVEEGLTHLLGLLPQARRVIFDVATAMGHLADEAGKGLSGKGFEAFFNYVETDAAPTLEAFGHTIGNVAKGLGDLIVGFSPLTRDFTGGMERMSAAFADWAAGLSKTQGFQDFISYVRESGPQVVDLLGAVSTALVGIVKAAAPVGHAVVPVLTAMAKALGALANSPLGEPLFTAAAGMIAFNRAASLFKDGGALAKLPGFARTAGTGVSTLAGDFTLLGTTAATAGAKTEREMARIVESTRRVNMALTSVGKGVTFAAIITGFGLVNDAFNQLDDRVNTSDLDRNLQAFASGGTVDNLSHIGESVRDLNSGLSRTYDLAGAFMTFNMDDSTWEKAKADVDQIDQALANMVESGNADQAAAAFSRIKKQAEAQGVSVDDVTKSFDSYRTALGNIPPAADDAATSTAKYEDYTSVAGKTAARTGTQIRGLVTAMQEQRSAALAGFDAQTQWGEAVKAANEAAAKGKRGISAMTEAGRENRSALSGLAAAWNNQSDAVKNNTARFKDAKAQFIQTATAMGVPIQKARELAASLLDIPKQRVIQIDARDMASAKIAGLKSQLATIDRDIYINIHARVPNISGMGAQIGNSADGGTVPKTSLPYADRHLYMLADGEEVISNRHGQADRYRSLLKAINANQRLANGGTAGGPSLRMFGRTDALGALANAADDLARTFGGISGSSKHELETRKKLLEHELERDRHEIDRDKQRLQMLQQERAQLMSQVRQSFTTDIFGGSLDLTAAAKAGNLGPDFMNNLQAWLRANNVQMQPGTKLSDYADQYLQTLSPDQIAALQAQASLGQLNTDASNAHDFRRALQRAKKHGLSGGLLHELMASGNLQSAQQFAGMSASEIAAYERAYKNRAYQVNQTAKYVGNDQYGKDIRQQLRVLEEHKAETKETNKALHQVNQRLQRLEHATSETGPKNTGKAVGQAINNAVSHGQRSA